MAEMEKNSSRKKEKGKGSTSLLDLIFSWSLRDFLDNYFYKDKVKQIPESFSSTEDYLNSFKAPLIEEIRADLCSGLEAVAQAPACEISSVVVSKYYKPFERLYYKIMTKNITDLKNEGGFYEPQSGDIILLTSTRPRGVDDVHRPGEPFLIAYIINKEENINRVEILSSKEIESEIRPNYLNKRLFATYLMNLTTNDRIWYALNRNPKTANLSLIQKVLQYDSAAESDCSVCLSQENLNISELISSFGLDESQRKAVLSSISMRKCTHQEGSKVKLIWGPPGTGKTKTVASLLFALLNLKCKTLTCAPTNIAVVQVAKRLMTLVLGSLEHDTYGLGDIILFGNGDRMKVDDHNELVDVFLDYRVTLLSKSLRDWKSCLESTISFLKWPRTKYNEYVKREGRSRVTHEEKCGLGKNQRSNREGTQPKEQLLMTYGEFVRKTFHSLVESLGLCAKNLYTHLPTSSVPLDVVKHMIRVLDLLKTHENVRKRVGIFHKETRMKREELLGVLKLLQEQFPKPKFKGTIKDFCLSKARLIFCTASSSIKVRGVVEMVIIDEAAQLKECESAIPLQTAGVRNAILIGDDRQLPAMVRSKVSEEADFGRSLFQRLATLGQKKHLLNIQYRMHPSISLFPNREFYEDMIVNAPNVKESSYYREFLKGRMYGSYSFINVSHGRENFDKGHSPRNVEEASVVNQIVAKLFKEYCVKKQKMSVGVISPYKSQVSLIQEKLGKKYANYKEKGFNVSVRSVDGFQGGEEDVIIISTVRCNGNGSVGFLSNHQRTNVALTRARYCLWIVGNGSTLSNSGSVWSSLVIDAKARECFYNADEDIDLYQVITPALVLFSDDFKISMATIKSSKLQNLVMELLNKLAHGWRELPHYQKEVNFAMICGVASELLEQYRVDEQLFLVWTVDIVKEESKYTQIIKVWDILPAYKIPKLAKDLDFLFGSYTVDFMNCCKHKSFEGNLVVPMSWPIHSVYRNHHVTDPGECLSGQLAALNLRGDQGESSSIFKTILRSKQKRGSGIRY